MEDLISITPHVLLATSMAAALTVVFVATLKILVRSFHRATAIVLALGVTILAVVGTAQIIFVGPQPGEPVTAPAPSGNALMLLPFVTLGIASLLAQLLAAVSGTVLEGRPGPSGKGSGNRGPVVQAEPEPLENAVTEATPRGRPRKQLPETPVHDRPDDLKKKASPPKQQQVANAGVTGKQKTSDTAASAE